ncbi:MAG TPA: Fur family transcriptional regulator [Aeromicrobium sp.]|nr:Fur family transcriptional regulator [Aeromicrobium sp.]
MSTITQLRERGLRVTRPRIAVLEALVSGGHLDVEQVRARAIADAGSVSVQTVYDVLATLCEAHLVRRLEPAGSPALFELQVGDNHHHLVCRTCGRIEDVEVTWWGTCPACKQSVSSTSSKEHHE